MSNVHKDRRYPEDILQASFKYPVFWVAVFWLVVFWVFVLVCIIFVILMKRGTEGFAQREKSLSSVEHYVSSVFVKIIEEGVYFVSRKIRSLASLA